MPRERKLLIALAVSALVHGLLLFATGRWASGMPAEIAFPIEASFAALESPVEPVPGPAPAPAPAPSAPPREAMPVEVPPEAPQVTPEPVATEPPRESSPADVPSQAMPRDEPAGMMMPRDDMPRDDMPRDTMPRDDMHATAPAMPVSVLPERAEIRYAVRYGSGGFVAGEARYSLQARDGRYALTSSAEAKGLASLFVSGRITQSSEGTLTAEGLRPENYAMQQGERRRESARFDWQQNQLVMGGERGSAPLSPGAQDLLSFPFHLAAMVAEGMPEFTLAVSNGRKLQEYRFQVLGMERLELPGGAVDTLRVQGRREGAGTLEVWLDPKRSRLPVMVRTLDQKGKEVTLVAEELGFTPAEVKP